MRHSDRSEPTIVQFYVAGLFASGLGYLGILLLLTILNFGKSGDPGTAVGMFFVGGFVMLIPSVGITFLISAPLASVIGVILRNWLAPNPWHGAINGALTVVILLILLSLLVGKPGSDGHGILDAGLLVFTLGAVAIGTGSGWMAQHKYLRWPAKADEDDVSAFE